MSRYFFYQDIVPLEQEFVIPSFRITPEEWNLGRNVYFNVFFVPEVRYLITSHIIYTLIAQVVKSSCAIKKHIPQIPKRKRLSEFISESPPGFSTIFSQKIAPKIVFHHLRGTETSSA